MVFIALLTAWTKWKQDQMSKTVDVIHTLSNKNMGDNLHIGMVSAKALAAAEPTPENDALAKVAEDKYLTHQAQQDKVDAGIKTGSRSQYGC